MDALAYHEFGDGVLRILCETASSDAKQLQKIRELARVLHAPKRMGFPEEPEEEFSLDSEGDRFEADASPMRGQGEENEVEAAAMALLSTREAPVILDAVAVGAKTTKTASDDAEETCSVARFSREKRFSEANAGKSLKRRKREEAERSGPKDGQPGFVTTQERKKFQSKVYENIKANTNNGILLFTCTVDLDKLSQDLENDNWKGTLLRPYIVPAVDDAKWHSLCDSLESMTTYCTRNKGLPNDVIERANLFTSIGQTKFQRDLERCPKSGRPQSIRGVHIVCSWANTVAKNHIPPSTRYRDQRDGTMVIGNIVTREQRDAKLLENVVDLTGDYDTASDFVIKEEKMVATAAAESDSDGVEDEDYDCVSATDMASECGSLRSFPCVEGELVVGECEEAVEAVAIEKDAFE